MEPIRIELGRVSADLRSGTTSGRVVLTIDVERLARLHARKTLRNRSGRATLSDGAIVFLASDVKRVLHDDQRGAVERGDA